MAEKPPKLPHLRWDGHAWTGRIELRSWAGFQARNGAYGARSRPTKRPMVKLNFAALGGKNHDRKPAKPAHEQVAAHAYLVTNEAAITKAVLARVLREYPKLRAAYHDDYGIEPDGPDDDEEIDKRLFDDLAPLPEVKRAVDLRRVMGLAAIHVLDVARAGVAYVGLELGCIWDEEHGAGLMLHKRRIVKFGGADTSFLEWIAERDGGRRIRESSSNSAIA